jgi:hypothetical protein
MGGSSVFSLFLVEVGFEFLLVLNVLFCATSARGSAFVVSRTRVSPCLKFGVTFLHRRLDCLEFQQAHSLQKKNKKPIDL